MCAAAAVMKVYNQLYDGNMWTINNTPVRQSKYARAFAACVLKTAHDPDKDTMEFRSRVDFQNDTCTVNVKINIYTLECSLHWRVILQEAQDLSDKIVCRLAILFDDMKFLFSENIEHEDKTLTTHVYVQAIHTSDTHECKFQYNTHSTNLILKRRGYVDRVETR